MITRRTFLKLIGVGGAAAILPFAPVPSENLNDRLEQVCFSLGRWSRKHNVQIHRVIMADESGHLVFDGKRSQFDQFSDCMFHLADRKAEHYTRLVYRVEPRYLMRTRELSVIVHVQDQTVPYRFPLVFGRTLENLS